MATAYYKVGPDVERVVRNKMYPVQERGGHRFIEVNDAEDAAVFAVQGFEAFTPPAKPNRGGKPTEDKKPPEGDKPTEDEKQNE